MFKRQHLRGFSHTGVTMKHVITLAAAALTLTACNSMKSGAEKAVRADLNDPESARFGDLYFNEKTKKGCLTVNAKNAMGGYTGNQQAYVQKTDSGWETHGIGNLPLESCRHVFADATY